VVVLVKPPPVPVIVIVCVPVGVSASVEIVKVLVNVGFPEDGLKLAEAPEGSPEAVRVTVSGEPPRRVTVTVV
jgi:hypothetical protein